MELFEAINTTRAIRRYTDEPVTDDEIMTCMRAAVQAPSGGNIQPWQFLVITDPEVKRKVGEIYKRSWDRYAPAVAKAMPAPRTDEERDARDRTLRSAIYLAENIGTAPAMVAFLMPNIRMTLSDEQGELDTGTGHASILPAVQNFMLAARGLGIGTALTTVYRIYQDDLRELLSIPESFEVIALVPMGRPKGKFGVAPRRPAEKSTHWNSFGNRR
ncbi:MAG: nitroreductase family protein [Dehalococcoidia bacterium]